MLTLLPCPFCGGELWIERAGNRRYSTTIACTDCGCRHESGDVDDNVGTSWNRRQSLSRPPDSTRELLSECRELIDSAWPDSPVQSSKYPQTLVQRIDAALAQAPAGGEEKAVARSDNLAGGGWISVNERFPKREVSVLWWDAEDRFQFIGALGKNDTPWVEVTHWMPLPQPPVDGTVEKAPQPDGNAEGSQRADQVNELTAISGNTRDSKEG